MKRLNVLEGGNELSPCSAVDNRFHVFTMSFYDVRKGLQRIFIFLAALVFTQTSYLENIKIMKHFNLSEWELPGL